MKRLFFLFLVCCSLVINAQTNLSLDLGKAKPFPEKYFHHIMRGSLKNAYLKFQKGGEVRVAFLGGSITEMKGWHNMLMEYLPKQFPQTKFDFVEAGIPSMGSTPHAFRLVQDVLSKGKIDLLFFEAVANDETNEFTPLEQIRGMEGVIRHVWNNDPETDIIMLYFIREHYVDMVAKGQQPDVIFNHERVGNHYLIPTVNLVQEIGERIIDGEFSWKDFGGEHPAPLGHQYYTSSIIRLMQTMWQQVKSTDTITKHVIPEKPLDEFSYVNGDFVDIKEAKLGKGWEYVPVWRPNDKYDKRFGFVDVPMLESKKAGSKLTLRFNGRAVGICCVAGPSAGILEYSIDGKPFKKLDTYTHWSYYLYLPWVYMFETELESGNHQLVLKISSSKNEKSLGTECQIRNFVVNK